MTKVMSIYVFQSLISMFVALAIYAIWRTLRLMYVYTMHNLNSLISISKCRFVEIRSSFRRYLSYCNVLKYTNK